MTMYRSLTAVPTPFLFGATASEDAMPELRDAIVARLGGRAPAELIEAVSRLPCDGRWFNEAERILGIALVGDILGEIINSAKDE